MNRRHHFVALVVISFCLSGVARTWGQLDLPVGSPAPLNTNADTDSGFDEMPRLAASGAGHWVAVWESDEDLSGQIGTDQDVLFARSADNGLTWSAPAALNSNAASDNGDQEDGGIALATDGAGTLVVAWYSVADFDGAGTDTDLFFTRSTDHGATWSTAAPLNTNARTDTADDHESNVTLATNGAGLWIAAWLTTNSFGGELGSDHDLMFSRSMDNGVTWSDPAILNTNARTDSGYDWAPALATDGNGNWVVVWQSDEDLTATGSPDDLDILYAWSSDSGATWSAPAYLNSSALDTTEPGWPGYDGTDKWPQIATDGAGHWITVWWSETSLNGIIGDDSDILYATSSNNGRSWAPVKVLNSNAAADNDPKQNDRRPKIATAGGQWVVVWQSRDDVGGSHGTDADIMIARTTNNGQSWTDPMFVNSYAEYDSAGSSDRNPYLATDGAGTWLTIWRSHQTLADTIDNDGDILYTFFGTEVDCITPGTPIPDPPTKVTATGAGFSWTSSAVPGSPRVTFYWAVGTGDTVTYESGYVDRGSTTGTTAGTTALSQNTTYCFRVKACTDCDGSCSDYSPCQEFVASQPCAPPTITGLPVDQTVCAGPPATFTVIAEGEGTLEYQWRHDESPIAGATDNSYTITTVQLTDAGSYDVLITDECGSTTSPPAELTVAVLEVVITASPSLIVCEGTEVTLDAGPDYVSYLWSPTEQTTSSIQVQEQGTYTVKVIDADGCEGTANVTVTTLSPGDPGDFDGDCDVDLDDYAHLQDCLAGPDGGISAGCDGADLAPDSNVDLEDVVVFQKIFTGPR